VYYEKRSTRLDIDKV